MKRNLALLMVFLASFVFSNIAMAAEEKYTFDPDHTYVLWHINHFGFSNPSGKWLATGTLMFDQDKPQNSKVNITIKMADVSTGISELDKHLKGPLFFDTNKYPTATFVSDKVDVTGKNTAVVHGVLTLHGVSKPVALNVHLNKMGENPINNKMGVGFSGSAKIDRSDFGINTLLPGLGNAVTIDVEAEAYR